MSTTTQRFNLNNVKDVLIGSYLQIFMGLAFLSKDLQTPLEEREVGLKEFKAASSNMVNLAQQAIEFEGLKVEDVLGKELLDIFDSVNNLTLDTIDVNQIKDYTAILLSRASDRSTGIKTMLDELVETVIVH